MRRRNLKELKELVQKICPGIKININAFLSQEFTDMLESLKPSLEQVFNMKRKNQKDKETAPDLNIFNPY